jgi:hypothetical protein
MSDEMANRDEILSKLHAVLAVQEKISGYVHDRLCRKCEQESPETWDDKRKEAFKNVRGLIDKYSFSQKIPRNDLGILTQAIISHLLDIQHTFLRVLVMIDMIRDDAFDQIFMDSLTTISDKVHEMMSALGVMIQQRKDGSDDAFDSLDLLIKLERQIDEDNIVICRQISVVTAGDSDFTCYMMRKIVAELEHISDHAKECAEIIAEI